MWRWRGGEETTVTCIACGETLSRADAREYDKHGDRWDRREKSFEYLCKPCHRTQCHHPRHGLEALLTEIEERGTTTRQFIERYYESLERSTERTDRERER